jgi:hypothetical protein
MWNLTEKHHCGCLYVEWLVSAQLYYVNILLFKNNIIFRFLFTRTPFSDLLTHLTCTIPDYYTHKGVGR